MVECSGISFINKNKSKLFYHRYAIYGTHKNKFSDKNKLSTVNKITTASFYSPISMYNQNNMSNHYSKRQEGAKIT